MDELNSSYTPELGDWVTLTTVFQPLEAFMLRGVLQAAGVPAAVADAHLVQAHGLLAPAIPVRVLVPEQCRTQAEAVLAAFHRGDYRLDESGDDDMNKGSDP
ncbi:DUF2007 domain-containing protein [Hydrogenophaga sp. IBVHS2]|uniref:putative signal transducing protein n=1 Tax=Hydrogenophaga sp. IBVHS2 TaxID=1985170 RepID=UPI000A2E7489|nr:DUF2007 domain-containing protein [Hydrogenophaga sp. IBVHS2]OSZ63455.1 hypothetical protein CAP38_13290 [Hydrogenophaga sp. IBVHS2]